MTSDERQKRGLRAIVLCLVATALLTALDLGSKHWAQTELSRERSISAHAVCEPDAEGRYAMQRVRDGSVVLVDGYLELRYAENCGAAFGMLDESPRWLRATVFFGAGAFWVGALLFMFVSGTGGPLFAWSVPFILSGAVGNLIDRARLGYVVDFVRFHLPNGWEYPTFNVADVTIAIGIGLFLLDNLRGPRLSSTRSDLPRAAGAPLA